MGKEELTASIASDIQGQKAFRSIFFVDCREKKYRSDST
jgi:hypothetical protein